MLRVLITAGCFLFIFSRLSAQQVADKQGNRHSRLNPPGFSISNISSEGFLIDLPPDGTQVLYSEERLLYSGVVKKGKLDGKWQSHYVNGQLLDSGQLVKGYPDGVWKIWDSSGRLVALRSYDAQKLQLVKQEMKTNHPRNYFYELTALYKKNKAHATAYLNHLYSFPKSSQHNGRVSLNAIVVENQKSNNYQAVFAECLHDGLFINYFSNGLVKDSGDYRDGLQEGVWLHRNYIEGFYWVGAYKKGKRVNEWKQYTPEGRLVAIIFYSKEGKEKGYKKIGR